MVNVDSRALWLANSTFNAAGVLAAAKVWSSIFDRQQKQLFWFVPSVFLSAWLETNLNAGFAGAATMTAAMYQHFATDVAAFGAIALFFVWVRRKAAFAKTKPARQVSSPKKQPGVSNVEVVSDPSLRSAVANLLSSVDSAEIAALDVLYDKDFLNVRVAEDGGFAQLTREQLLLFLRQAVAKASKLGGHAAVQTRETIIHHADNYGETASVLMTRVKDLGNGWEPLFYCLLWKKRGQEWRLAREFVHQKTTPRLTSH
jgi:hypothetical protein